MSKLMRFASSQENVDRVAIWVGVGVAVLGVPLAIATVVLMIIR
ncbi:hypothetical protein Q3O98_17270 [Ralstonia pseudosolanacearum]|nr:hypothetical protein [Ralstonia pseudosolanacearum]MDO3622833.1 hypothetical protein [Ralstonia pseudosolanacearum]